MGKTQSTRVRVAVVVLINLVSLAALVWTLRDADMGQLRGDLAGLNWWWVAGAAAAQLSAYAFQALRWKTLVAPVVRFPFLQSVRAVFVGLFASELLPFRGGELLRSYLMARWTGLPFSVSVTSVIIERVVDGLLMWVALQFLLKTANVSSSLVYLTEGLGGAVLIGGVVFAVVLFSPEPKNVPWPVQGWRRRMAVLRADLAHIGHSWSLGLAFVFTVPYLLLQVVPIWVLTRGYEFVVPASASVALMLLLRLAAALPQAPATLGVFQVVTKEFLETGFAIPAAEAARFSLLLWAVVKLPLLAAGAVALAITGAKMGELTKAAEDHARENAPHRSSA